MNDNITWNKNWYFPANSMSKTPDGKITVIIEEEGRRLVQVDFENERPLYYIQRAYINHFNNKGHWIDECHDRSKNKMIRKYKGL